MGYKPGYGVDEYMVGGIHIFNGGGGCECCEVEAGKFGVAILSGLIYPVVSNLTHPTYELLILQSWSE